MSIFTEAILTRYQNKAENHFVSEFPCLVDRVSLAVVSGTSQYTLSDNVLYIRRVTYRGWQIDPMSQRDLRNIGLSGTQGGKPQNYIFNNIGKQKIQLFPVPSETLAQIFGDALWGSGIADSCVIEFYSLPDYISVTLPDYMKRNFLKIYSLAQCYLKEGKTQNIKAFKYYMNKWGILNDSYIEMFTDLINKPRNLMANDFENVREIPFARLPIADFGISVDNEY